MNNLFLFLLLTIALVSCQTAPHEKSGTPATSLQSVTCTLNKDTRLIEIQPFQQTGCNVLYTKFKTAKSIAKAQTENGYCLDVRQKIVTNLTNSGFVCE